MKIPTSSPTTAIDPRTIRVPQSTSSQSAVPSHVPAPSSVPSGPRDAPGEPVAKLDGALTPATAHTAGTTPKGADGPAMPPGSFLAADKFGGVYIAVSNPAGNPLAHPLNSSFAEGFMGDHWQHKGLRLNSRDLRARMAELKAYAAYAGRICDVWRRVAHDAEGHVVIALHDPANTHVRIAPGRVELLRRGSTTLFTRSPVAQAMASLADEGDLQRLKRYVNLSPVQFTLYVAWLTYTLAHPKVDGSIYPLLVLVGGQGTGKSHVCKVTMRLTDPSSRGVGRLPASLHDLALASQDAHVLAYDNLRHLTTQQSDSLCIMATGGTAATRKLYTDDESKVLQLHAAVVLNSIASVVDQPDLAQRSLTLRMEPMAETARRSEGQLLREFEADLPFIQRALFDLIAQVLLHLPTATVAYPQRMIDFVRWLAAMERAHGLPPTAHPYQLAYDEVIGDGQRDSLQDNVLGAAVLAFAESLFEQDADWKGSPSDLYAELTERFIKARTRPPRLWPDNEIAMSKRLVTLQAALQSQGVDLAFARAKSRVITIRPVGGAQ